MQTFGIFAVIAALIVVLSVLAVVKPKRFKVSAVVLKVASLTLEADGGEPPNQVDPSATDDAA